MVLLNPGPVNVSERVRQALLRPDICHRESEFTELLHRIQSKLLNAFVPGAESEYVALSGVDLPEAQAEEVLKLVDRLEQDDDVQKVFHNLA